MSCYLNTEKKSIKFRSRHIKIIYISKHSCNQGVALNICEKNMHLSIRYKYFTLRLLVGVRTHSKHTLLNVS